MSRYQVIAGSRSGHCCFDYSIVDMTKPTMMHGKHYDNQYEAICECFDKEDANMIAKALNRDV